MGQVKIVKPVHIQRTKKVNVIRQQCCIGRQFHWIRRRKWPVNELFGKSIIEDIARDKFIHQDGMFRRKLQSESFVPIWAGGGYYVSTEPAGDVDKSLEIGEQQSRNYQ